MANRMDYSHIVQAYFDNEMSAEERLDFEQLIDRDPMLKEEFDLQKDVMDGIREYRRQEIKAHLNQIPVGGIVWTPTLRWAVLGSSALVAGALAYYFIVPTTPVSYSEVDFGKGVVLELSEVRHVPSRPDVQEVTEDSYLQLPATKASTTEAPKANPVVPSEQSISQLDSQPENETSLSPLPSPTIVVPEFGVIEDESSTDDNSPEVVPGATFVDRNRDTEKVDMEVIEDRKYSFHYQFFNNKLYLYGDFEGKIYEIIEFNDSKGREFFLYFRDSFYRITQGQRDITKLELLEDKTLVQRLRLYRQNNLR